MPTNAVRGPEGEEQWERAKKAAIDQYGDISKSDPEKFYSIVMTIYKSMCTKHKCSPKAESISMSKLISLLESKKVDWKTAFPSYDVQQKMEDLYPEGEPDYKPISDALIERVKKIHVIFEKYMKMVSSSMKDDDMLKVHYELLKKADDSFKWLISGKDKWDWVNVNARLKKAHNSLYQED